MQKSHNFKDALVSIFDCFHVYDLRTAKMELYHNKALSKDDRAFLIECIEEAEQLKGDRLLNYKLGISDLERSI